MTVDRVRNFLHKVPGRYANRVGFSGCIDFCQNGDIDLFKRFHKVIKKSCGSGIGMGLEGTNDTFIAQVFGGT